MVWISYGRHTRFNSPVRLNVLCSWSVRGPCFLPNDPRAPEPVLLQGGFFGTPRSLGLATTSAAFFPHLEQRILARAPEAKAHHWRAFVNQWYGLYPFSVSHWRASAPFCCFRSWLYFSDLQKSRGEVQLQTFFSLLGQFS